MEGAHSDQHSNMKVCRCLLLVPSDLLEVSWGCRFRVVSFEVDVFRRDMAGGYHCDEDQYQVRVVVEEVMCREVEVVGNRDRRNVEVGVFSLGRKVGHRNVVVVCSHDHSHRCCEVGAALDGHCSRRSVRVAAVVDDLVRLHKEDDCHGQDACRTVWICPESHTRSVDLYRLGLRQVQAVVFDLPFVSVYRIRESPPSLGDLPVSPATVLYGSMDVLEHR